MRVMIIDDEKHMTEYLKHLINWQEYGFDQVEVYNRGLEAQKMILQQPPELVLTDIRMPEITGLQIAETIAEHKLPSQMVIISGYSDFEYAQKAMRYGVREFLLKPVVKKDFLETLERLSNILEDGSLYRPIESEKTDAVSEELDPVIAEIQQYVREHYDEVLTLDVLGQIVHFNSSYLSAYYKKLTGQNLLSFVTDVRMEKAAELLRNSELKVNAIGEMVGYHKTQYFISRFKKKYGVTPQQYRKQPTIEEE